jgi:hypothetical protein
MRPRTPGPDSANKPHRHAIAFGKQPSATVFARRPNDSPRLLFRKLSATHLLTARAGTRPLLTIVALAPGYLFRLLTGPVFGTPGPPLRMQGGTTPLTPGGPAVPIAVCHVFECRGPIEIARRVIGEIAVAMRAVWLVCRLRTIERLTDKSMHLAGNLPPADAKHVREIAAAMGGWGKNASDANAAMVRHIPSNAALVRYRVGWRFGNFPPVLHEFVMTFLAYNSKACRRTAEARIYRGLPV